MLVTAQLVIERELFPPIPFPPVTVPKVPNPLPPHNRSRACAHNLLLPTSADSRQSAEVNSCGILLRE